MPLKRLINNSATMAPESEEKAESHRVKCFHRKDIEAIRCVY